MARASCFVFFAAASIAKALQGNIHITSSGNIINNGTARFRSTAVRFETGVVHASATDPDATDADPYEAAVKHDDPVAYYRFDGNVDDEMTPSVIATKHGDPQAGYVNGIPAVNFTHANQALHLEEAATPEEVTLADSTLINTKSAGYSKRTIEFWFRADDLGTPAELENQTIFEEGGGTRGISIFVGREDAQHARIYAFMYNRKEKKFGTSTVDPVGISCPISEASSYYFAFVFDATNEDGGGNADPMYRAYIAPFNESDIDDCGSVVHIGEEAGKSESWKSEVKFHKHGGDISIGGVDGSTRHSASEKVTSASRFIGVIDEFAIYNKAVSRERLLAHFTAGVSQQR